MTGRQTDYVQKQSLTPTNNSIPETTQDPALKTAAPNPPNDKKTGTLSEDALKVVKELKKTDSEVRAHEAAHLAAAGGIATGGASFNYQQGPDGIRYAIGGEVSIDTAAVSGDPAATLRKAETIKSAALAPAHPSGPDLQVAASASAMSALAQAELLRKIQDTQNGDKDLLGTNIDLSA